MNSFLTARRVILLAILMSALSLALFAGQPVVQAHGYVVRAIPADRSVLPRSPSRIQIWFSENLEPKFSQLTLSDEKGSPISLQDSGVSPTNPGQLSARVRSPLPDGAYIVTLRAAFASDGHVVTETLVFWVGQQTGSLSSVGPARDAVPLEVIWRILTIVGLSVLFGTTLLYQVVLLPGWGNPQYRAGKLPPRVMTRLSWLVWSALILAAGGTAVAAVQQATVFFSTDISAVLRDGLWSVVLRATQTGDVLTLRIGLVLAAAALQGGALYLTTRQPDFVSLLWALNTVIAGALLGTLSAASHAAGSTLWPILAVAVDWLHLLAISAWIGGLAALALTLPAALAPLSTTERRAALMVTLRRFSAVGVMSLALLTVTGLYSALLQVRQPADLTGTTYGVTLLAKVILVLPLLPIALYHHGAVAGQSASNWMQRLSQRLFKHFENLLSSVRLEASGGIAVILLAALLTATPPPVPPESQSKVEAPFQTASVAGLQVKLTVDPGAAGSNSYEIDLTRAGQPVIGAQMRLEFVYPALDKRTGPLLLDDAGDGTYLGAGAELDRSGQWDALIDLSGVPGAATDQPIRAAFAWTVTDVAALPTTRQPAAVNWLSGMSIVLVMGVLFLPGAVRKTRSTKTQPEIVVIGVLAGAITVAAFVIGAYLLADSARRSDALRNPVPAVVNPILADAASMSAGKSIYEAHCAACHGETGAGDGPKVETVAPPDLRNRLPNRRDEELYAAIRDHKGLDATLTDEQRWNVVNYLRSEVFAPGS